MSCGTVMVFVSSQLLHKNKPRKLTSHKCLQAQRYAEKHGQYPGMTVIKAQQFAYQVIIQVNNTANKPGTLGGVVMQLTPQIKPPQDTLEQ
jgi:hypothetical protein